MKAIHKDEFVGKGKVKAQLGPSFWEFLVDGNELGVEDSTSPTDIITLQLDMVQRSRVKFPHKIDFCHGG